MRRIPWFDSNVLVATVFGTSDAVQRKVMQACCLSSSDTFWIYQWMICLRHWRTDQVYKSCSMFCFDVIHCFASLRIGRARWRYWDFAKHPLITDASKCISMGHAVEDGPQERCQPGQQRANAVGCEWGRRVDACLQRMRQAACLHVIRFSAKASVRKAWHRKIWRPDCGILTLRRPPVVLLELYVILNQ